MLFQTCTKFYFSLFATPTLIKADWQKLITGVGVVKVVPWNMSTPPGELTRLSPSQQKFS